MNINGRKIGAGNPTYIVAELSGNHNKDFNNAAELIKIAKEVGADAVKLQTYTPDSLTIDCNEKYFHIGNGTIWEGNTLYNLYKNAYTPWEWQPKLLEIAKKMGITLFSSPFDNEAVDFLIDLKMPAYKIASFELSDTKLLQKVAKTNKPVIISVGMATLSEIDESVRLLINSGAKDIAILKCTSAYPASPEEMNLITIPHLMQTFNLPVGLSDHSIGTAISTAAVSLGASIIEKHITLDRSMGGPDSDFSMEPKEFKQMVNNIRIVEKAMGKIVYSVGKNERNSILFKRSLFVVKNISKGELFTPENIRSIRPGHGIPPKFFDIIIGKRAKLNIKRGTPLDWNMF